MTTAVAMDRIPRKRTAQESAAEDRTNDYDSSLIQQGDRQVKRQLLTNRSQQLCWQFQRGFCTSINCQFLHKDGYGPIKRNQPCKFWLQNNYCRFGDRCWYLHSDQCEVIPATSRERVEQPSIQFPSTTIEVARASIPGSVNQYNLRSLKNNAEAGRDLILNLEKETLVKLWVGNLPWSATEDDISDFFRQEGLKVIECDLVTDKSGRSRGFAFVTMSIPDARRACNSMNGTILFGRSIKVNMSDTDPSRFKSGVMSVPASNLNVVSTLNLDEDDLPAGKFVLRLQVESH